MKAIVNTGLIAAAAITLASCSAARLGITPEYLHEGDKIALIAPSYATSDERVRHAADIIRDWGFEPVIGPNVGKRHAGAYAGTPTEREEDLLWALRDTSIKAIICTRGGYGTLHMVGDIDIKEFSKARKWLVGYSDITTLHAFSSLAGVQSIHGPMGTSYIVSEGKDLSSTLTRDLLLGKVPSYHIAPHPQNIPGTAEGTLIGGNLYTLFPLIGSGCDPMQMKDIILFFEEVGESFHGMDRILNLLKNNGVFDRVKAVILGEFTESKQDLEYDSIEQLATSYLKPYGIPVMCGFPAGHADDINVPLILGAKVRVEVGPEGSSLSFSVPGEVEEIEIF